MPLSDEERARRLRAFDSLTAENQRLRDGIEAGAERGAS